MVYKGEEIYLIECVALSSFVASLANKGDLSHDKNIIAFYGGSIQLSAKLAFEVEIYLSKSQAFIFILNAQTLVREGEEISLSTKFHFFFLNDTSFYKGDGMKQKTRLVCNFGMDKAWLVRIQQPL